MDERPEVAATGRVVDFSTTLPTRNYDMTPPVRVLVCVGLTLTAGSAMGSAALSAANWPGWRGPEGQGISTESGLPTEWSSSQNVAWKVPVGGRGHSSPIVWGDRVFLTTAVEGDLALGSKAPTHRLGGKEFVHP